VSGSFIARAFTGSETAIHTASLYMRIVPISYLALGVAMTATSSFNAVGRPLPGMFISMMRTVLVYAPLSFVFAGKLGLPGIFAAACVANYAAGACGLALIRKIFSQFHHANAGVL